MEAENNVRAILERAIDVLGSEAAAHEWVDKRSATLGGIPREVSQNDEGMQRVLFHLSGISRHRFG